MEIGTASRTSEGSKPPGSPVGPQRDPTSSPHPQHESSYNLLNQWGEIFAPTTLQEIDTIPTRNG